MTAANEFAIISLHAIIVTTVYRLVSVSGEHHFLGGACWVNDA